MTAPADARFHVRQAVCASQIAAALALRHQVFCVEQSLFTSDLDTIDTHAITLIALQGDPHDEGDAAEAVIGTVRLHQDLAQPHLWFGSRLAVAPDWRRRAGLGAALIRMAVGIAHGHGCTCFRAHVQARNVAMFETLHWHPIEACELHGAPHCLMQADLAYYPKLSAEQPFTRQAA